MSTGTESVRLFEGELDAPWMQGDHDAVNDAARSERVTDPFDARHRNGTHVRLSVRSLKRGIMPWGIWYS
jgi:hypothetical protein